MITQVSGLVVALLVASHAMVADGNACSNIVPGLYKQSRGVDVTKLDLMPIDPLHREDGYMRPVIQFTCNNSRTRTLGGVTYNLPDQVSVVTDVPSGSLSNTVQVMKTSNEARRVFTKNTGVDLKVAKFGFSSSRTYSRTQTTLLKNERKVEFLAASFSTRRVDLQHRYVLSLGEVPQLVLGYLPTRYVDNPSMYEDFIKDFGTHYIEEGMFGGVLMMYLETKSDYFEKTNEETVSIQASASFDSFISGKTGLTTTTTNNNTEFTSSTNTLIQYLGGSANLIKTGGIADWQPTIQTQPGLFLTRLRRISHLIRDRDLRASMDQAIDDYLMRHFLVDELTRVLRTLPSTMQSHSDVTRLFGRIQTMKTKYPLVESEVDDLGDDVFETYARLFIEYDNSRERLRTANSLDNQIKFVCPAGQSISEIQSHHHNHYEDRIWKFKCAYLKGLPSLSNCKWTHYLNGYDGALKYECPGNGVVKGWYSVHHNYYEDRRHRFMCCDIAGLSVIPSCRWTNYVNNMDGALKLSLPASIEFVNGASSFHSNHHEDRRWKFRVCKL